VAELMIVPDDSSQMQRFAGHRIIVFSSCFPT
jgi:hypothetical protein